MNRISRFISGLPAGDSAIAGGLLLLTLIACLFGLSALVRSFQVIVPAHGGSLSEGIVGSPRFANPLLAISDSDRDLVALTYAGLMGHAPDGRLIPVLAESYTVSSDSTLYTFVLRPGIVFSDGTPVTAEDVVYTVQKVQDPALKSPLYASWANIRAEALDAHTVRFTLPNSYAPFLEDTTLGILPKHLWQSVDNEEFPFSNLNTMPVGAGPFVAKSVSRDSRGTITGYTLTAFKEYALGRPYLSRIRLSFYESLIELQEAYGSGKVTSMYGNARAHTVTAPYARVFGVFFNADKDAELSDLEVRKALSLAVDRTRLTQELLGGYATPLMGPLPAGGAVRALPLPEDEGRLEAARAALGEAGYEYSEETKVWSKDGEPLTITLTTSNVPELRAVAGQVQEDWRALGVTVQLELHDAGTMTQSVIRPRAYSALLFGEVIGTTPDLYAFWSSSARTDPGLNIANYNNSEVDTLLTQSRTTTDPAAQAALLAQIQEIIGADYPAAFLYTPDFLYTVPDVIHGVVLTQVSSPSDRFRSVERWYRYSEHVWPIFVPEAATGGNR